MQYSGLFYLKKISRSIEWELRASELRTVIPHPHRCVLILCKQNITCLRCQRWGLFLYVLSSMVPKSSVMCAFLIWQFTPCVYVLCVCMIYSMGVHPTLVWRSEEDPMESILPPTFKEVTGIKLRSPGLHNTMLTCWVISLALTVSSLLMSSFVCVWKKMKLLGELFFL